MLFLIVIPVNRQSMIIMEQTLDQLREDKITRAFIMKIEALELGKYFLLRERYLIIRIE